MAGSLSTRRVVSEPPAGDSTAVAAVAEGAPLVRRGMQVLKQVRRLGSHPSVMNPLFRRELPYTAAEPRAFGQGRAGPPGPERPDPVHQDGLPEGVADDEDLRQTAIVLEGFAPHVAVPEEDNHFDQSRGE